MHIRVRACHREDGIFAAVRAARTLLSEFLPLGDVPAVETTRRRTMRVGARLEQQAASSQPAAPAAEARPISLFIDGGHVRSVRSYQVRSFEVMLAQVSNDDGKQVVFSSMPAEADRQRDQLRSVPPGLAELVPPVDAYPTRCQGNHELAGRRGGGSQGKCQPCRDARTSFAGS